MGEAKEDLVVAARRRIGILYAPTGNTKRKIKKIDPLLKDVVLVGTNRPTYLLLLLLH